MIGWNLVDFLFQTSLALYMRQIVLNCMTEVISPVGYSNANASLLIKETLKHMKLKAWECIKFPEKMSLPCCLKLIVVK